MKKRKLLLTMLCISPLFLISSLAISCGNQTSSSEPTPPVAPEEPNPPITPEEPEKPIPPVTPEEPNPPVTPEEPEKPIPPIESDNTETVIRNIWIKSKKDKFEIEINGKNLIQNSENYVFTNNSINKYFVIDSNKSTSSSVYLYTEDYSFQNNTWTISVKNKDLKVIHTQKIEFGNIEIVNSMDKYIDYIYDQTKSNIKKQKDEMKTVEDYINLYNKWNNNKYIIINNNVTITSRIEINYNNISNNKSSIEYSLDFNIFHKINVGTEEKKYFNSIFINPDPVNDCLSNVEYITQDGLHIKNDSIVGYSGTSKDVVLKDKYEFRDKDGNKFVSKTITNISDSAFENKNLNSISFNKSLRQIGNKAFLNNSLKNINFSDTNVLFVGNESFSRNKISYIEWNDFIKIINESAFSYNNLDNNGLNLKNSKIETIKSWAFSYNIFKLNIQNKSQQNIIDLPLTIKSLYSGCFEVDNKIDIENAQYVGNYFHSNHGPWPHYVEIYDYSKTDMGGPFFRVGNDLKDFWKRISVFNLSEIKKEYKEIVPSDESGKCPRFNITTGVEFYNGRLVNEKFYGNQWDTKMPIPYSY